MDCKSLKKKKKNNFVNFVVIKKNFIQKLFEKKILPEYIKKNMVLPLKKASFIASACTDRIKNFKFV
jgi:hypothetical protein